MTAATVFVVVAGAADAAALGAADDIVLKQRKND